MEVQRAARYGHDLTVAHARHRLLQGRSTTPEGHQAGDRALKAVAEQAAVKNFRATDSVCRWGGEEFAVIMPETSRAEGNGVEFVDRARRVDRGDARDLSDDRQGNASVA